MKLHRLKPKIRRIRRLRYQRRRGLILLLVMVVVVALSVATYSFSKQMLIDLAIGKAHADGAQQKLLSDSIVEQLLACDKSTLRGLCSPFGQSSSPFGQSILNRQARRIAVRIGTQPGLVSIPLPDRDKETGQMAVLASFPRTNFPQFGLSNQSAKLNLNALTGGKLSRKQVISKLTKYENLSQSTAEGIANHLGVFDSQTNFTIPGAPRNPSVQAPRTGLRSVVQLLTVPGVTEDLLLGEDRNANGMLDFNENDGSTTWPPDNADGILDAGWSAHWTLIGAESNYRSNGEPKINLNQPDLVALYDQIIQFATQEEARFVVAWRISSPIYTDTSSVDAELARIDTANDLATTFDDRLAKQLGIDHSSTKGTLEGNSNSNSPSQAGPPASKIRAGLDLATNPARKLKSLLDLASCQLQLIIDGKDTVLVSPFANDPASLARWLTLWEERTCTIEGNENPSRINILQASQATLTTVEGISAELAKAIVAQRVSRESVSPLQSDQAAPAGIGWLLESGLVTTSEMRNIADEITVGGDVFQGYAIGQLSKSRTANIQFIELDGRGPSLALRRSIELAPLSSDLRLPIVE